jgi:hypothetical protein
MPAWRMVLIWALSLAMAIGWFLALRALAAPMAAA